MKWLFLRFYSTNTRLLLAHSSSSLHSRLANADPSTFGLFLRHCSRSKALQEGRLVHLFIVKKGYGQDTFLGNLLIKMYASCGCLDEAIAVFSGIREKNVFSWNIMVSAFASAGHFHRAKDCFDRTPEKDIVSWTTMMTAFTQGGRYREALQLFKVMDQSGVKPDQGAFVSVLTACSIKGSFPEIRSILEQLEDGDLDVVLGTSMVGVYGKFGRVHKAREVFHRMIQRNAVSWSVMIEAFAENGDLQQATELFDKMPERTTASWVVIISSHARADNLEQAGWLLENMPERNLAAWTAVIAAEAHSGYLRQALLLLQRMDQEGVAPDRITLVNILDGCSKSGSLATGKTIESGIVGTEFMEDDTIVTNLINLHGKCCSVNNAVNLFEYAFFLDSVILWSATIAALAQNDRVDEAFELFRCLCLYGMVPTKITFSIVLFGCSHGGLLRQGRDYFRSMQIDHFLSPDADHFVSMIDLLARSGWIESAAELTETMPFLPDDVAWTSLLNASKLYGEPRRAKQAAKKLVELGDEDSAPYVLLAGACRSTTTQQEHEDYCA